MPRQFDLTHVRFEGAAPVPFRSSPAARPLPPLPGYHPPSPTRPCRFAVGVLERAGLDPEIYRPKALERRVPACLRALKTPSQEAATRLLDDRPELLQVAIDALLIGVTEFFRDAAAFLDLRNIALACLSERERLRVWSPGSSSGAELYSVAMLLAEAGLLDRTELLGTDCRPHAISEARAGVFQSPALGAMPEELRARYFEPAPPAWRVTAPLRNAARWRVADFASGAEQGSWDLVLWRNAAIYLDPGCAHRVALDLIGAVRPGGFLMLGKAERPPYAAPLERVGHCLYRKEGPPR